MDDIDISKFPLDDTNILLSDLFFHHLKRKLKEKYKTLYNSYEELKPKMPFSTFKSILKSSYPNFRPLRILLPLCMKLNISLSELQKNIISYKSRGGYTIIDEPVLPIKVTPIFNMIISHIMGDGCSIKIDNRKPYFVYTQYNTELRRLFIKKVERVFGALKFKNEYFHNSTRVYIPSIVSCLLSSYYSLSSKNFLGEKAYLPENIYKQPPEYLLTVLIAFIIDEGNIDSGQIVIGLHNKQLLLGLQKICNLLNYKNTITSHKHRHCLYILADGVKNFLVDYKTLKKKYPEIYLGYKENYIENFILRKTKRWRSKQGGETKNQIIKLLKNSDRTIKELANILYISRQGIKYHIRDLEKIDIVTKQGLAYAGSYSYKLKRYTQLSIYKKGRSRQYGITNKTIIKLLSSKELTTRELADKLDIYRATILHFLFKLEKQNKIKRVGKKIHKTSPSILWKLVK